MRTWLFSALLPAALVCLLSSPPALAQPKPEYSDAYLRSALHPCEQPEKYGRDIDNSCVLWPDLTTRSLEDGFPEVAVGGLKELREKIPPPAGQKAKVGGGRMPDLRVTFLKGSAELDEQAKTNADTVARVLKENSFSGEKIRIAGHTDVSGGDKINRPLSLARAQAVADYLVQQGVPSDRLEVAGMASDQLLRNASRTSSKQRRVEATQGY